MKTELGSSILRVLPFLIVIIVILTKSKEGKLGKLDLFIKPPSSFSKFVFWWGAYILFTLSTEIILYYYGLLEVNAWNHTFIPSIILIAGAIILAPLAEELIFRGILLEKMLSWKIKKYLAICLQSIVFIMLHNFTYENTLSSNISIATSLIDGILFAFAKYETKSIYTSMSMHATGNLIATLERFIL